MQNDMSKVSIDASIREIISGTMKKRFKESQTESSATELYNIFKANPSYRHSYSNITAQIIFNFNESNSDPLTEYPNDCIDVLSDNATELLNWFQSNCVGREQYIWTKYYKLYDHIMLEVIRLGDNRTIRDLIYESSNKSDYIQHQLNSVDNQMAKTRDEVDTIKGGIVTQVVTVLSIFAAVVIAFFGGMSLLNSGFNSLQFSISSYRLFFMLTLVGFVLYNIIISLLFIVCRINGKDIGVYCKEGYGCYCGNISGLRGIICQAVHKYPYIIIINSVLLYILYAIVAMWSFSPSNTIFFPELFHSLNTWIISGFELILLSIPLILFFFLWRGILKRKKQQPVYPANDDFKY